MSLTFGNYEIYRRLAVGGMGEVFLAVQRGLPGAERLVIIKTLLPDLARERDLANQFLDEARVITSLNHPNVVSLLEVGIWQQTPFIAMELIKGRTVSQLRRLAEEQGRTIDPWSAATIIRDAALGLHHAHRSVDATGSPMRIVHRDVSPQNLMVRVDGVTKVLDFGIASAANRAARTETGVIKGKLVYMAPEQISGAVLTSQVDQFALGAVLWELLAGRRLFQGDSEAAIARKILEEPMSLPSATGAVVPSSLEVMTMRMLERRPEDRFPDCGAVAAELERCMSGQPSAGATGLGALVASLGTDDLEGLQVSTGLEASPDLLLSPATGPPELAATEALRSPRTHRTRPSWPLRMSLVAAVIALLGGGVFGIRWWNARVGATGKLQTLIEQNAWLADRSIDRFCKLNDEIRPMWPRLDPPVGGDAAAFFNGKLRWEDSSGATIQEETLVIPAFATMTADAGPGTTWISLVDPNNVPKIDLGWFSDLGAFDHWSVDPPAGALEQHPYRSPWPWETQERPWTLPAPRLIPLQPAAKLRLYDGLVRGDLQGALTDVDRLKKLARSTNLLIGEMIAVALAGMERAAIEEAQRRKMSLPEQNLLPASQYRKVRDVMFSAIGFFLPGVSEGTRKRAAACSVSPCSAMYEAAAYYSAVGPYLSDTSASSEGLVRLAMSTPGCNAKLIALQARPQRFDPVSAVAYLSSSNGFGPIADGSAPRGVPTGLVLDLQ